MEVLPALRAPARCERGVTAKGSLRLHLPNVCEVESGNGYIVKMTYSDDVIADHQRMV